MARKKTTIEKPKSIESKMEKESSSPDADDRSIDSVEVAAEITAEAPEFLADFVQRADAFRRTTPLIVNLANNIGNMARDKFREYVPDDDSMEMLLRKFGPQERADSLMYLRDANRFFTTASGIPTLMLTAIISDIEVLFSEMCKWAFAKKPEKIRAIKKTLEIGDLDEAQSIDELRNFFLDKEIDEILRRSPRDQVEAIEKLLDVQVLKSLEKESEFLEIFERRNIMLHAGGKASRQYVAALKRFSYPKEKMPALGTDLSIHQAYFMESGQLLLNFGALFGLRVWHKYARDDADLHEQDGWIIQFVYDKIISKSYRDALQFIAMAEKLEYHFSDAASGNTMIINKAQCFKWLGDDSGCQKVLGSKDWSAHADNFLVCVHVLKDDFKKAAKIIKSYGAAGKIKFEDYCSWPVFQKARENEDFAAAVEGAFGKKLVKVTSNKLTLAARTKKEEGTSGKRRNPKPKEASVH